MFATVQVLGCQGLLFCQEFCWLAIEHDVAACLARAWANIDNAIGGQHELRVVLDYQQGIACVSQSLQHTNDSVHILGMQADTRFIQNKQGVDQ